MSTKQERLVKERGKSYGPPLPSLRNIGRAWQALLSSHYRLNLPEPPPYVVSLMILAMKNVRAAQPTPHHQDNYDDGFNYLKFAEESSDPKKYELMEDDEYIEPSQL